MNLAKENALRQPSADSTTKFKSKHTAQHNSAALAFLRRVLP